MVNYLNMSLYNLFASGQITEEVAMEFSDDKTELAQMMKGVYSGAGGNNVDSESFEDDDDDF